MLKEIALAILICCLAMPVIASDNCDCGYLPHLVQFQVLHQPKHTIREWLNATIFWDDGILHTIQTPANVTITAIPDYIGLQETRQMLSQLGIYSPALQSDNLTMVGITDAEGQVIFPMHKSIKYNVTLMSEEEGIDISFLVYPHESDYTIWVR